MQIYKTEKGAVIKTEDSFYFKKTEDWDAFINRKNLHKALLEDLKNFSIVDGDVLQNTITPMGSQEIWASGVTYMRSKEARMEESKKAGGGTFYDRVYDADRPELFFKATPQRTVGDGGMVRIRKDSGWDVPEPELTLFISSEGTIEGYTIGNDMSSRSIEGENPLYLPQAKTYEGCAGLGPCLYVPNKPIHSNSKIKLEILRKGSTVFSSEITIDQMKRKHSELVDFLFRECSFPKGCFLMTGTGIIPPDEFTLLVEDEIRISIDHIGTLVNFVGQ
ncbi:fumarylacetoacetate hydrolase family protein [Ulvibacterium sp.]|uniref:fumarylacetoacetate hydrolase family protein n=1 Tax=Ulvibacterium sp. TaxID=2665914 RepID=UPI0026093DEA|nr:fumarylacetoacetate hydrolase family protein [Ulvibacterium sp.]